MHVDRVAAVRAGEARGGFEGSAAGAVDALAVLGQPLAHLAQPLDLPRLDPAVGHRADVEQQVAVAADARTSVWMHSWSDFIWSSGFHAHCWQIVMHVSQGRRLKPPTCCSGVS